MQYVDYYASFTEGDESQYDRISYGELAKSFGFEAVKGNILETIDKNRGYESESSPSRRYTIAVTMKVQRSYSTIKDSDVHFSHAAHEMLRNDDYTQFFIACGSKYVRAIHRAQEVTAVFNFEEDDSSKAQSFSESLRLHLYGNRGPKTGGRRDRSHDESGEEILTYNMRHNFDDAQIMDTLSIDLYAYGLGLNQEGTQTLIVNSLDEFNNVMRYAYDSMVRGNGTEHETGLINQVEVVPWADNMDFVQMAGFDNGDIFVPVPRGLMEKTTVVVNPWGQNVSLCLTVNNSSAIDDLGYCCDPAELMNVTVESGNQQYCLPHQYLPASIARFNLDINAEFVSWLTNIISDKVNAMFTLRQCVNSLRTFPKRFDYNFLESSEKADYGDDVEVDFTVKELKSALDPNNNMDIVSLLGREHDEYVEMFYLPCISALQGANTGFNKDLDPKHIMAKPWYNHPECNVNSCLDAGAAWDRENGHGCIDGLLKRNDRDMPIPSETDQHCALILDKSSGNHVCKFSYQEGDNPIVQMDDCREKLPQKKDGRGELVSVAIGDLVDYFCMPQLGFDEQATVEKMDQVDELWDTCGAR
jgi:hypothetical protein